jgi:hypothetical protein
VAGPAKAAQTAGFRVFEVLLGEIVTVLSEDWAASTDRYLAESECGGGAICADCLIMDARPVY